MRFHTLFPAIPFPAFCIISAINFKYGFFVFEELKYPTLKYLVICGLLFLSFYIIGFKKELSRKNHELKPTNNLYKTVEKMLPIFIIIAILGQFMQYIDVTKGGVSLDTAVEHTQYVRHIRTRSSLSTVSVLFLMFWLPSLSILFKMIYCKQKISVFIFLLFAVYIFMVVLNSVLNVNRNPILNIFILFTLMAISIYRMNIKNILKKGIIILPIFLLSFLIFGRYIVFIQANRTGQSITIMERVALRSSRYDLAFTGISAEQIVFLPSGSYYLSHHIRYMEACFDYGKKINYYFPIINQWLWTQIKNVFPVLEKIKMDGPGRIYESSGILIHTWSGLLGSLMASFGYVMAPVFLVYVSYLFGRIACRSFIYPTLLNFSLLILFYYVFSFPYKYFESNHYTNGLFLFIIFLYLIKNSNTKKIIHPKF